MSFGFLISASNTSCPTWFYYSNTSQECQCGVSKYVQCNQQERKVEVHEGYCVTSHQQEGQYYVGQCPFGHTRNSTNRMYFELPSDPDQLNGVMCGPYNRKGLLCGRCIDGYGPAVNQLDLRCANCSKVSTVYRVAQYLLIELVPSSLCFICVVLFRINITAGPLLGYVLFCQVFTLLFQIYAYIYICIDSHATESLRVLSQISLILSAFWNMIFFKPVIPPLCISEKLTGIHMLLLSTVSVNYPIVLGIIACILIELHARNYKVIHILWKPFSIILKKTNITAVNSHGVMHAFATYILLSSSANVYSLTSMFKRNTVVWSIDGTVDRKCLYFDSTVIFFSREHVLYLVIEVVISIFLVLIPSLLLCVYPTRIYISLSRCISARVRLGIMTFAEALNCCFKDGLNGTRDYRVLAAFIILSLPVFTLVTDILRTVTGYHRVYGTSYTFFVLSLFLSYIRPCKSTIANLSLSYHCIVLGFLSIAKGLWDYDKSTRTKTLELTLIILPLISHILVFIWVGYTISHYIWLQFGHPFAHNTVLTRIKEVASQCFHRRRGGYQALNSVIYS